MLRLTLAALAALLLVPATASAVARHAEPAGDGPAPCAPADPCSLTTAYATAVAGQDTVNLAAGTYDVGTAIVFDKDVMVLGDEPTTTTLQGEPVSLGSLVRLSAGALSRVRVVAGESNSCEPPFGGRLGLEVSNALVDRVRVDHRHPCGGTAVFTSDGATIRNSFIDSQVATGVRSVGSGVLLRNVTARSVIASALSHSQGKLTAQNSIFSTESSDPASSDVQSHSATQLSLRFNNFNSSNYTNGMEPEVEEGTVSAEPLLDADGSQQAGSPTIDKGRDAGVNPQERDLHGDGRVFGDATDIGADEFLETGPPRVGAPQVLSVRAADALLTFPVFANNTATTVAIEYDEDASFATPTVRALPSTAGGGETYEHWLTELDPTQTYHVRVYVFGGPDESDVSETVQLTTPNNPGATVDGPTATNDATPTFTLTPSRAGVSLECRIVPAPFEPCSGTWTPAAALADGQHTLEVRAGDGSTNTTQPRSITIDTAPPQTTITSAPGASTTDTSVAIAFAASEAGSSFACSLDGAPFTTCAPPQRLSRLALGEHTFRVRSTDALGNTDPTPASVAWTVLPPPSGNGELPGPQVVEPPPAFPRPATLQRTKLVRRRTLELTIVNPNASVVPVEAVVRSGRKVVGRANGTVGAGATTKLRVTLSKKVRAQLKKRKRVRVKVVVSVPGLTPVTRTITLRG